MQERKNFFSDLDTCPDNFWEILACDTSFTPKIPAIWQCQDSMLSQKLSSKLYGENCRLHYKDKLSDKIRSSKICDLPGTSFLYLSSFIGKLPVFAMVLQTTNSIKFAHFSVLTPFQRFIPISVSAFSFRFRDSVSAFYSFPANSLQISKELIEVQAKEKIFIRKVHQS